MENSIILAKLLGPYCLIVSLGILLNLKSYRKLMDDFLNNSATMYLAGLFALIFGLLVAQFHNKWVMHWTVIITLMGWFAVVKGIWLIAFPSTLARIVEFDQKYPKVFVIRLVFVFVVGVILSAYGYFLNNELVPTYF